MFVVVANWMTKAAMLSILTVFTIQPAHYLLEYFNSIFSRNYIPLHTSGNRTCTHGSRSYTDLLDTWADSVCIHQLVVKPRSKAVCIM